MSNNTPTIRVEPFDIDGFLRQFGRDPEQVTERKRCAPPGILTEPLRQSSQELDLRIKGETHQTRQSLIWFLSIVTLAWLIFTATVVVLLGVRCICFNLTDTVAVAFLTTSLGTVLALLTIGLRFILGKRSSRE